MSSPATGPFLGNRLLLSRMGSIFHIPRHLLLVPARVNNFLLSGRFLVGAAKGMCKVYRTKRFELIKRKMLSHTYIIWCCGRKETYQGAATILKHSHAKLQRFLPGRLHQRTDALIDNLRIQLLVRTTHAIICTSILMHQVIAVLKRLNLPGISSSLWCQFLSSHP
jgi:hypothetical protein